MASKCKPTKKYSQFNLTDAINMGCALPELSYREIREIQADVYCDGDNLCNILSNCTVTKSAVSKRLYNESKTLYPID